MDDAALLERVLGQALSGRDLRPRKPAGGADRTEAAAWTAPGMLGCTRVMTQAGPRPAALIAVGDALRTRDGHYLRVRRITDTPFDEALLARCPAARPVILRGNRMGTGAPQRDVLLSPAQLVSVGSNRVEDRLVPAAELSRDRGGVDRSRGAPVYLRFHLGQEAQISAEGLWLAIGD